MKSTRNITELRVCDFLENGIKSKNEKPYNLNTQQLCWSGHGHHGDKRSQELEQ